MHSFTSLLFRSSHSDGVGVCQYLILVFLSQYKKKLIGLFGSWRNWNETLVSSCVRACWFFFSHNTKSHALFSVVCTLNESEWQHQNRFTILLINDCASIIFLMSIYWMFSHIKYKISNLMLSLWNGWR